MRNILDRGNQNLAVCSKLIQEDSYRSLAWYYRELIKNTGRLDDEVNLVQELLCRIGIGKRARILDFACGTGDVLFKLKKLGWGNVFGLDGSPKMIARTEELETDISFTCCKWNHIQSYFDHQEKFDFAFALSISLPHMNNDELDSVFANLRKGIKKGGWLCFDFRQFMHTRSGKVIEPNRPEGVFRWCGEFKLKNDYYWVEDQCSYYDNRQLVLYRIKKRNKNGVGFSDEYTVTVSYALFNMDDYISATQKAGFNEIEISKSPNWPYLVLTAKAN